MSLRAISTENAAPPMSRYSQAIEVKADCDLLYLSGQVGAFPDGTMAEGEEAQHEQVWANILAILVEADMGPADIVEITAYVTASSGVPLYREVRDRVLDGAEPASTLIIAAGLAHPSWLVELSIVAAKRR